MDMHIHTHISNPTQHTHLHIHLLTGGGPPPSSNSAFLRGIRARADKSRQIEAQRLATQRANLARKHEKARGKLAEKQKKLEWKAKVQEAKLDIAGRGLTVGLGQFGGLVEVGPWISGVRRTVGPVPVPVVVTAPAGGAGSAVQGERGVVGEGEQEVRQGG
jgi:hypothetical protein